MKIKHAQTALHRDPYHANKAFEEHQWQNKECKFRLNIINMNLREFLDQVIESPADLDTQLVMQDPEHGDWMYDNVTISVKPRAISSEGNTYYIVIEGG